MCSTRAKAASSAACEASSSACSRSCSARFVASSSDGLCRPPHNPRCHGHGHRGCGRRFAPACRRGRTSSRTPRALEARRQSMWTCGTWWRFRFKISCFLFFLSMRVPIRIAEEPTVFEKVLRNFRKKASLPPCREFPAESQELGRSSVGGLRRRSKGNAACRRRAGSWVPKATGEREKVSRIDNRVCLSGQHLRCERVVAAVGACLGRAAQRGDLFAEKRQWASEGLRE